MTAPFQSDFHPSTSAIADAFEEEVTSLGGTVVNVFDDGQRLFARGVLPVSSEVRRGDMINGGVAIRVSGSEIEIHPYVLREICTNGSVMPYALQSRQLERVQSTEVFVPAYDVAVSLSALRDAVRRGASAEAFTRATIEMQAMVNLPARVPIHLFHAMRMARRVAHTLPLIMERFTRDGDRSAFGLMNAVTSIARDTDDPETRWALEQVGGAMPGRFAQEQRLAPTPVAVAEHSDVGV